MNKETEEKIAELQSIEQNLQRFLSQKQQFQTQIVEMETAINELKDSSEAHKIVGNIMVSVDKKKIQEDLNSKKEMLELRLKTVEKQEKGMREKADAIQQEVMKVLNKENK